jgi:predicted transcriptional regulator
MGEKSVSEDALGQMAYLARSRNRLDILETLATGPHTPREIEEATGASRSTLERIVAELVRRGWAERTNDGEYVLTDTGEHVAAETGRYVGALEAIATLGDAVGWLPTDELTVGLHRFRDATVLTPERNDVAAADTRIVERMRESDEFACLSNTAGTVGLETTMMEGFTEGRLTVENVITPGELDVYRDDPKRAARWEAYVEAGADVYCYRARIPCNVILTDEAVFLGDRHLETVGVIESTDDAVRAWAEAVIERHRNDAERLAPSDFGALASTTREPSG